MFLDDLHLMPDRRVARFLCELAARLPDNVHLIAASRDKALSGDQLLRLGGRLHRIGAGQLRLEGDELAAYAHRFGAALDREQLAELQQATEGWMAAVYLHLQALADRGTAPAETADIYDMFTAAMLRPLPPRRQKFLAVMGLADEFTGEMARFITKEPDTAEILSDLTAKNAFVTRLPGGGYRFHHMMKACAQRDFDALPPQEQATYQARYGHWYAENGQYLQALAAYSKAGRWDDALEVVQQDAGILLAALRPQQVLELLDRCGDQVLMEHPTALLVLMRRMFTWGQIPRMQQLKALLLESVRNHPDMTPRQRGNLLGECDLITSFLSPVRPSSAPSPIVVSESGSVSVSSCAQFANARAPMSVTESNRSTSRIELFMKASAPIVVNTSLCATEKYSMVWLSLNTPSPRPTTGSFETVRWG